jgi:hypothetical protein
LINYLKKAIGRERKIPMFSLVNVIVGTTSKTLKIPHQIAANSVTVITRLFLLICNNRGVFFGFIYSAESIKFNINL